jgi:hypothetical protein
MFFRAYLGWSLDINAMAQNYLLIAISFFFLSQYRVRKCLVCNGPKRVTNMTETDKERQTHLTLSLILNIIK